MMFEKYDAYKDSGVEWIGKIPTDWFNERLGTILEPISIKGNADKDLLSITREKGVILRDVEDDSENHNFIPDDLSNYKLIEKGQFGMNKMKAWQGSYGVSPYTGIVSPAYYIFKFIKPIYPDFFHWAIRSKTYISFFGSASDGVRIGQWDLSKDRMKNIPFVFPNIDSQKKIVEFIQDKAGKIDQAIAIKEQQIALLNERKQIVIQKAVTQGLDPNVPMKDSGVEWIGQIPEYWELKKIKHVTSKIGSGVTPSGGGATYLDEGIPLLRSQNIHFNRIDLNDVARISEKVHHSMSNSKVRKNDVLLNITGGSIGRCYFVETSEEMNVNQHVCILRPKKNITSIFLNAVLASEVGQGQIWYFQQGGGREGLNFQALKNFDIALPPIEEQILISKKVEEIYQQFGNMNAHIQMQIEKLKEYKTTLINDAVTGKIKVA
ncbi:MAG: restriction endonuclease subunit S [Acinetobacter towneri]|nr:restriction endonuclease subunit S [Acinetobacter towneri]